MDDDFDFSFDRRALGHAWIYDDGGDDVVPGGERVFMEVSYDDTDSVSVTVHGSDRPRIFVETSSIGAISLGTALLVSGMQSLEDTADEVTDLLKRAAAAFDRVSERQEIE